VDAIVGAAKYMHTVLIERCTGCELCLPPCPVDCIEMRPGPQPMADQAALNRARFDAHNERLRIRAMERQRELDAKKAAAMRHAAQS
jgi:electron transport complex protein RnfB